MALAVGAREETESGAAERPRRVRVAEVSAVSAERSVRFSGVTRAAARAELAFTLNGRLLARPVEVGQAVASGDLVGRIDDTEMRLAVAVAEAGLADSEARWNQADSERRRVESLFAAEAATSDELERAAADADAWNAARDAAAAHLRDARRLLSETTLRAPFAGVVTEARYQPGEIVTAGRPVVVLSGSGAVETEVGVPESLVLDLATGDRVTVDLPLAGITTQGTLQRVGQAASAGGGLFPVLVALDPSAGLLPGMTAEVQLALMARQTLTVPLAAVLNPGGGRPRVFRLVGDRVEAVDVEVSKLIGDRVAVEADLMPGDEVVIAGNTSLIDGDRVEVLR